MIYFVTSNKNKFKEAKEIFGNEIKLKLAKIKLEEIQSDRLEDIAKHKAESAFEKLKKSLIVEDSGLFIKELRNFPGAYSSFILKTIGIEGILKLLEGSKNREAFYKCVAVYKDFKVTKLFIGKVFGKISEVPRGSYGFGFDPIFIPKGYEKTFGEDFEIKNQVSHRAIAFRKLKNWLMKNI